MPLPDPRIIAIENGVFSENCYLVADPDTREAVIVDPGDEADRFLQTINDEQLDVKAVWLTHAHIDHVSGLKTVVDALGVETWVHPADRVFIDRFEDSCQRFGLSYPQPPQPEHDITPGDTLTVGGLSFDVRFAPGHSPGSVVFVGHGVAIAGDVLFYGSVGRVDLPGGDGPTLIESIERELLTLPDETVVYPGHGPSTTIGRERVSNPFVTRMVPLG